MLALYNYNGLVTPRLSLYNFRFILCSGCVRCSSSAHRAPGKKGAKKGSKELRINGEALDALRFYAAPLQIYGFFGTVLGVFGVAFVRALVAEQITAWLSELRELKELLSCEGTAFPHLFFSTTPLPVYVLSP